LGHAPAASSLHPLHHGLWRVLRGHLVHQLLVCPLLCSSAINTLRAFW
jgi:hypothetical protein